MEKIGKFNLLEKQVCTEQCHCGWHIKIGGKDVADLARIYQFLKDLSKKKG